MTTQWTGSLPPFKKVGAVAFSSLTDDELEVLFEAMSYKSIDWMRTTFRPLLTTEEERPVVFARIMLRLLGLDWTPEIQAILISAGLQWVKEHSAEEMEAFLIEARGRSSVDVAAFGAGTTAAVGLGALAREGVIRAIKFARRHRLSSAQLPGWGKAVAGAIGVLVTVIAEDYVFDQTKVEASLPSRWTQMQSVIAEHTGGDSDGVLSKAPPAKAILGNASRQAAELIEF